MGESISQLYVELGSIIQQLEGSLQKRVPGDKIMIEEFKEKKQELVNLLMKLGEDNPLSKFEDQ